jgi:hypothetical protein
VACSIWCFEPNVLAHASLMTPDAHATALGLAACYSFWRWLKKPTWSQAALTGVVLGLAELAKTTLILLYPLWPLMWFGYRWSERRRLSIDTETPDRLSGSRGNMTARDWLREAGMLGVRMAVGLYILNLGYGFEGSLTPLRDLDFVSELFAEEVAGQPTDNGFAKNVGQQVARLNRTKRVANSWLGPLPMPFPKNYLLGIDIQQRDFEDYGRQSYLSGRWRDNGWWYYYLYAVAIKTPLSLWLCAVVVLAASFLRMFTPTRRPICSRRQPIAGQTFRDGCILLFPAIFIFFIVSFKTGFNEHLRYVLPTFPAFFIFISQVVQHNWLTKIGERPYAQSDQVNRQLRTAKERRVGLLYATLVSALGCWFAVSSLWVYPHSLSYFNESIGGPLNGASHLLGSNVDWGQDIRYLAWRLDQQSGVNYAACFTQFPLASVSIHTDGAIPPIVSHGLSQRERARFFVSANLANGMAWTPPGNILVAPSQIRRRIAELCQSPVHDTVGYSMNVYNLPQAKGR